MLTFLCLSVPPLLMTWIYFHGCSAPDDRFRSYSTGYITNALLLYTIMTILLTWTNTYNSKLFSQLNQFSRFTIIYASVSCFFAVLIPLATKLMRFAILTPFLSSLSAWRGWRFLAICYALLLFLLNFILIFENNFWGDEGFTIQLSKMSFGEMLHATAEDVHPPLYYIIVQLLCKIFGYKNTVYHLSALIPYGLLLIFSLIMLWKRFGKGTAILFISFASLLPNAVLFNLEVRMYSWGAFFVLSSYFYLYEILTKDQIKSYFIFIIMSLCAAYTHYYCLVSVSFFYFVLLLTGLLHQKKFLKRAILASIATIIAYLPWFFVLLKTFQKTADDYWIANIPSFKECWEYLFYNNHQIPFFCFFLIGIFVFFLFRTKPKEDSSTIKSTDIIWIITGVLSIIGTAAVGIGISKLFRPMFMLRYLYPVSPITWLLTGVCFSRFKGGKICIISLFLLIFVSCLPSYKETYIIQENCNQAVTEALDATANISSDDIILTDINHMDWTILDYYYPGTEHLLMGRETLPPLDHRLRYWAILSAEMDNNIQNAWEIQGYKCKNVIRDGVLGAHVVYIYEIVRTE